jgi:ribokinase
MAAPLALERLAVAGRVLECGEPRLDGPLATLAAHGREHRGRADEAADQERTQAAGLRLPVHATIVGAVICTLGDVLLDVVVRTTEPLAPGADSPVETRLATGGQAANVASWVAELGMEARCVAKLADDAAGALVRELLKARGVALVGPRVSGSTGVVVALVAPDGERTMATDRGVSPELREDDLEARWFDGCSWLHLSGYALLAEPIAEAALAAARLARAREARVSVDLASWSAIRAYGAERFRANLDAVAPDAVFANEPEWEIVGGAYALAETSVVKRGSRGVEVRTRDGVDEHSPLDADVVDTTGAGDALAAGFLVGGIELGLEAAARCVGSLGAVPS